MASQTNQALKAARRFVQEVERSGIALNAAYLYGSFAKGKPHADSDIDIALISKDLTGGVDDLEKIRPARTTQDSRIEEVRFHPRDFRDENPLVWEIKTKGILLTRVDDTKLNLRSEPHKINFQRVVQYWRRAAQDDWRTAKSCFSSERYSYALGFARAYLEKILKAVIVECTHTHAPYRSPLPTLARITKLSLSKEERELIKRVESYKQDTFEQPDAGAIRRKHTRAFTSTELDAIHRLGVRLAAKTRPSANSVS